MQRRTLVAGSAALIALPALAQTRRALTRMTEGPFYPPAAWRARWTDQDADLSHVRGPAGVKAAQGEHLGLEVLLADTQGRPIDNAAIEIWQCDALRVYRHPDETAAGGSFDDGFQGFGITRSNALGQARLRTIKPVAYPGRTPHIHFKLRHASFGEFTSQLFVAGDGDNPRDFLWRSMSAPERDALEMTLLPAAPGSGLRWQVRQLLTLPAG